MPQPPLHPDLTRPPLRWRPWLLLWSALLLSEIIFLSANAHLDTLAWQTTHAYLGEPSPFYHHSQRFWEVMKAFGEPWTLLIIILLIAIYDRRHWLSAATATLAMSLAGGTGALIRIIDGRYRPTHIDGANLWVLFRGFHDGKDLAHPSGHATAAFAAAAVLTYLSPRGRPLFITLAALCAISRVIMAAHFWSDTICGAILGWSIAWWISHLADRLITQHEKTHAPSAPAQTPP